MIASGSQPPGWEGDSLSIGVDDFYSPQESLRVMVETDEIFFFPFLLPPFKGLPLLLSLLNPPGLLYRFIQVELKTSRRVLMVKGRSGSGLNIGDGSFYLKGEGSDPAGVGIFNRHSLDEFIPGLKGSYGVIGTLGATPFLDDEKFPFQGISIHIVESLGSYP